MSGTRTPARAVPGTVRVVLADDHTLFRDALAALLRSIPGIQVVADAGDGASLLRILEAGVPDVVLTDIDMPVMDGLSAIRAMRERWPSLPILVLSMHASPAMIQRAVQAGASGYVRKDAPALELREAIDRVTAEGRYISPFVAQALLHRPDGPADLLTGRQLQILTLLARGRSTKEIAFELGLSPKTVDVHRTRIMERLGLHDLASLTRYAVRAGLVEP